MEDFANLEIIYSDPGIAQNQNGSGGLFKPVDLAYVAPVDTSLYPSFGTIGEIVSAPFKAVAGGVSSVTNYIGGAVKNTYLYLIGGLVIVGVLAVVVLGAGTKFLGKAEGMR